MATFKTKGTCSSKIDFDIESGIITRCVFKDGCSGNLQGVSRLVVNRPVKEVIGLLEGIQCRNGTSCPDQLAKALKEYLSKK